MTPVIRLPDALYGKLEQLAVGFDTPVNVIERLVAHYTGEEVEKPSSSDTQKMTAARIIKTYRCAKDVYTQTSTLNDAVAALVEEMGMNANSARDYLNNFQKIMIGECYQRAMNGAATEYFLENILADFGTEKLQEALSAVEQHIAYYESHSAGKLQNIRRIHERFSKKI